MRDPLAQRRCGRRPLPWDMRGNLRWQLEDFVVLGEGELRPSRARPRDQRGRNGPDEKRDRNRPSPPHRPSLPTPIAILGMSTSPSLSPPFPCSPSTPPSPPFHVYLCPPSP